jgi:hypothetical protein
MRDAVPDLGLEVVDVLERDPEDGRKATCLGAAVRVTVSRSGALETAAARPDRRECGDLYFTQFQSPACGCATAIR